MKSIFEGCVTVGQGLGEGVMIINKNVRNIESKKNTFHDTPLSFFPLAGTIDTQRRGRIEG